MHVHDGCVGALFRSVILARVLTVVGTDRGLVFGLGVLSYFAKKVETVVFIYVEAFSDKKSSFQVNTFFLFSNTKKKITYLLI